MDVYAIGYDFAPANRKMAGTYFGGPEARRDSGHQMRQVGSDLFAAPRLLRAAVRAMRRIGRVRRASPNEAATIVSAQFENPPKSPWSICYVRLDGASTAMVNFIKEFNMSDLQTSSVRVRPAACVKVKWIDKPEGRAIDAYYVLA